MEEYILKEMFVNFIRTINKLCDYQLLNSWLFSYSPEKKNILNRNQSFDFKR